MRRLIDANVMREDWLENGENEYVYDTNAVLNSIDAQPTVQAVEVVHARWLYDSGNGKYFCSACDEYAISFKKDTLYGGDLYEVCLSDYCPNCGAKMDGDGNG